MRKISTWELAAYVAQEQGALIDIRPVEAYNGWRLAGEGRGGHIGTARSLPARWAGYLDWIEIVRAKGLRTDRPLVVYGYGPEETRRVAAQFEKTGFSDVSVYDGFVDEWSADPALPMSSLPRYRHLVSADWLDGLMRTGEAAEYGGCNLVVCHGHYRNPADYEEGHIPGAIALDTNALESPETWNRRSPHELKAALAAHGITHDTTVVLYGRFSFPDNGDPFPGSSAGHLGAIRCAFIMLYAGVADVRVLNGGLQAWEDANLPLTSSPSEASVAADFGAPIPGRPELAVDLPEAREILQEADGNLVSVRSWPEYIGEVSGYNYIERKGRIPGSVFGNCGSDAYHMENYRNLDHTCREYHEVEALWGEVGVTADQRNAFYCGTGWRGSEAFLHAWLMGWPRAAVYDGGWFEWSNHPDNPTETGTPDAGAQAAEWN